MIKPQELRLGNWVYGFKTVWEVSAYDFGKYGDDEEGMPYEPIPLTAEWMGRCGFSTGEMLWLPEDLAPQSYGINVYICKYQKKVRLYVTADDTFYNGPFGKAIEYVHQLQNLYFALTGEELTIKYE